jgi:hypothetical protein
MPVNMFKVSRPPRAPANHAPVAANDTAIQLYTSGTVSDGHSGTAMATLSIFVNYPK